MLPDLAALHGELVAAVEAAGQLALNDFVPGGATRARIDWKAGGSPVTSADLAVDAFLEARLSAVAPLAWHSEERPESWQGVAAQPSAYVIDPIDGTRDFTQGGDAWCIVVGVLHHGRPVAGAVHVPARGQTLSAFSGGGAWFNGRRLASAPLAARPWRATGPKSAFDAFAERHGLALAPALPVPALAHRLLVPLKGEADIALARAGGHDWDIVASDCILAEAGAQLRTLHAKRPDFRLLGEEHPPLVAAPLILFDNIGAFDLTDPA